MFKVLGVLAVELSGFLPCGGVTDPSLHTENVSHRLLPRQLPVPPPHPAGALPPLNDHVSGSLHL